MRILKSAIIFFFITLTGCNDSATDKPYSFDYVSTKSKANEALEFCKSRRMNKEFCVLIDMGIHSGRKRFFVWDFRRDTITHSFLLSHGCCDNPRGQDRSKENPTFSNIEGSHCSSLGKFKIGKRGFSNWGVNVNYLLHGLEPTNNNALKREIVFHSWERVSDDEIYPDGTPEGWGCPTISDKSFRIIDPLLKAASKPVLMWIYNSKD